MSINAYIMCHMWLAMWSILWCARDAIITIPPGMGHGPIAGLEVGTRLETTLTVAPPPYSQGCRYQFHRSLANEFKVNPTRLPLGKSPPPQSCHHCSHSIGFPVNHVIISLPQLSILSSDPRPYSGPLPVLI